ncbi:ATP-binding protein [Kiloniella laminariae]|uniref:histidine kinase n=1 Tax=Kiloniella laminariae TaxID=454162 RepID=A0ABT4LL89_9PROT|nr:ATP-binding protein [Kiloniella laminariae]MCZ4281870.1 ATP-binding protein [Kiloniella laminariae]
MATDTTTQDSPDQNVNNDLTTKSPSFLKRFLPRSLLGRSLLIIITPLLLVQAISVWVFYDRHYETVTKRLAQGLAGDISMAILLLEKTETPYEQAHIFRLMQKTTDLSLTLHHDITLPPTAWTPDWSVLERRLDQAISEQMMKNFDFIHQYEIDTVSLADQVKIQIQLDSGVLLILVPSKRLFTSTTYLVILWMVGSSVITFGVAVIFMRNQVRPIQRLARAAESFGKGRDVKGFKPEGATEVRQASGAFIRMRSRIKRQVEQRTAMLAGVSHDLRTPLTRMKLQLAMAGQDEDIKNLQTDVIEMEQMINGYLAFARGEGREETVSCEITGLLRDLVDQLGQNNNPIDLHIEEDIVIQLRKESFKRAVSNLVTNAQRYAQHVMVCARKRKSASGYLLEITVDDDGPGIPPESRLDVLKPFFRLEQSRNQATGGVGLGLSIANDVISNHGGDLSLEDAPGGGLRARIILPF